MTTNCTSKHIEEFCSVFVSLNMNLSPASGPTIDAALLGEINDYTDLSFKITSYLKTIGIPILNPSEWVVASVTVDKSSSGVVTNVRLVDGVWMEYSTKYLGAGPASGFYDTQIGKEYYNVNGIPISSWNDKIARNILVERSFLLSEYQALNSGTRFINNNGLPEDVSGITTAEFVKNHSPGLPDPNVEFGEYFYTSRELFEEFDKVKNADSIKGLFNDTGTYFDVLSAVGSRFGKLFVANSIWGTQYLNIDSGYGTKEKLTSNGISVPDSAISSSVTKDYSAGYTTEYQLVTRTPGRYRRDQQEAISNTTNNYYVNPSGTFKHGKVLLGSKLEFDDLYDVRFMAWSIVKDHPIFQELGAAYAIQKYATVIDEGVSALYDMEHLQGYTWYKGAQEALQGEDFLQNAEDSLFNHSAATVLPNNINFDDAVTAWENYRRFWYSTTADSYPITQQGDASDNLYPDTFGFENFGTAAKPLGSRTWTISGVANLNYIPGSTQSRDFGYTGDNATASIASKVGIEQTEGIILADYGPIPFPSISIEANINGAENFIDLSNSTLAKGGTQLGGVAAINYSEIRSRAWDVFDSAVNTINDHGNKRTGSATTCFWSGVQDPNMIYTSNSAALDSDGNRKNNSELTESEQRTTINEKVAVHRREHVQNCKSSFGSVEPDSQAYRLNRHLFHKVSTLSWYEGYVYDSEKQGVRVLWREGGKNYAQFYPYVFNCGQPHSVPFIETISFSLVNELYQLTDEQMRFLESLSITINDGKMNAKYAFSEKSSTPDFRGMDAAKVSLQNVIR